MHIAILEYDIAWADKEANLAIVADALARLPHETDLVVLPEMFSTGFITEGREQAMPLAERNTQDTIAQLHRWAGQYSVAFTGSFMARTASQLYNRAFFIEPGGDETFYDKRHLFGMGGETLIYNRGVTAAPVVRFRGWDVKLVVCYDLRFPAWCRNRYDLKHGRYDLLVAVANWPAARRHAWQTLLAARAMENLCYTCGANRSGRDPADIDYGQGSSGLYDYKGQPIEPQAIAIDRGQALYYTIEQPPLEHFRQKFPAWQDADPFTLSL